MKNIIKLLFISLLLSSNINAENKFSKGIEAFKKANYQIAKELFEEGCKKNNARSCAQIAKMYSIGIGVKRNFDLAYKFYEESCSLNLSSACISQGLMLLDGTGVPSEDPQKSIRIFSMLCNDNIIPACQMELYACQRVYGKSRAMKMMKKQCKKGSIPHCQLVNKNIQKNQKSEEDIFRALISKCDTDADSQSCFNSGVVYFKNKSFVNLKKADKYFRIACNLGNEKGCRIALGSIERVQGIEEATIYARNLCEKGNRHGCSILRYYKKQEKKKSAYIVSKELCRNKDAKSCTKVAKILYDNVDTNLTLSMDYYKKGCTYGDSEACIKMAVKHRRGLRTKDKIILEENRQKALEYYEKACKLNNKKGCLLAKSIKKKIVLFQKKYREELPIVIDKCAEGLLEFCNDAARIFMGNNEYKEALEYFSLNCNKGNIVGCSNAATIYAEGKGVVEKNLKKAVEYYHLGCLLGGDNECKGESLYRKKYNKIGSSR